MHIDEIWHCICRSVLRTHICVCRRVYVCEAAEHHKAGFISNDILRAHSHTNAIRINLTCTRKRTHMSAVAVICTKKISPTELSWTELIDVDTYVTLLLYKHAHTYTDKHTLTYVQKKCLQSFVDSKKSKEKKFSSKTKSTDAIEKFQKKCG